MKITIEVSEFQFMKALALSKAPEAAACNVMAAVKETTEIDITEIVTAQTELHDVSLLVAIAAIGAITHKYKIE